MNMMPTEQYLGVPSNSWFNKVKIDFVLSSVEIQPFSRAGSNYPGVQRPIIQHEKN